MENALNMNCIVRRWEWEIYNTSCKKNLCQWLRVVECNFASMYMGGTNIIKGFHLLVVEKIQK